MLINVKRIFYTFIYYFLINEILEEYQLLFAVEF